jgi:hypothetical protein
MPALAIAGILSRELWTELERRAQEDLERVVKIDEGE